MFLLGDPDAGRALEHPLDRDSSFGPGQRRAGAEVDAVAEREVFAGVGPVGEELGGAVELAGVRLAAPLRSITVVPAGMSTPPTSVGTFAPLGSRP